VRYRQTPFRSSGPCKVMFCLLDCASTDLKHGVPGGIPILDGILVLSAALPLPGAPVASL